MKRSLWMLALLIAFSQMPLAAQQAPPELKTTLDQAVKAIDGGDQTAL